MALTRASLRTEVNKRLYAGSRGTKPISNALVDVLIETIPELVMEEGKEVHINNFGAFRPQFKRARDGRSPKTGEPMVIEARTRLGFSTFRSFSDTFKARVTRQKQLEAANV